MAIDAVAATKAKVRRTLSADGPRPMVKEPITMFYAVEYTKMEGLIGGPFDIPIGPQNYDAGMWDPV